VAVVLANHRPFYVPGLYYSGRVRGMELLKKADIQKAPEVVVEYRGDDESAFERIRCPLCNWRPLVSSVWSCFAQGTPEPPFDGCGTEWNTFTTRGRCPRCRHQWRWTSCLQCHGWSLHDDWYECG
jgi:DNA-directed RNA polymerase subunit RPC12/RpoP